MTFQYGDLRVDQLTYTSGSANQTVTVSGLVQQVTTGGTTSGSVRIEGNLTVTGQIEGDTITGNTLNVNNANVNNISGENLNYTNGTISGLIVRADATVSGNLNVDGTVTGEVVSGFFGNFTQLTGLTTTGTTANFTSGNFQNLSGQTITGDTLNITSGTFINISGGTLVVSGITITGNDGGSINLPDTVTGISGQFTFLSGSTVTGNTVQATTGQFIEVDATALFADNVTVSENVVVTGDVTAASITGTTITGTTVSATTGNFTVIEGPVSTTTVTGVTRIATADEAASAVGPSGTYTDAISGNADSAFAINPSGLSSAMRAYDPPVGGSAGAQVFARVVTTTGIAPDFAISGITWSGINLSSNVTIVDDLQATSAVRPSGTYGVTASGNANSQFVYNPVQLEKTFKAYDPVATAAEDQLYARIVSGTSDGQGGFNTTSYGWIQVPTGTPSIATEAQAQAAAGTSGTYSEVPTAANLPNLINPNRLRSALQAYDPGIISGERRIYARSVSGITDTTADYNWVNVGDVIGGDFLAISGGTVTGYTQFTAGLGISGNVQVTGNITQTGNHTTSGTYNASRASSAGQVLYQVNNSAGRGMYQGDHQGVAFAKGASGVAEFTVTGDQTFAVLSGDLRVGGDAQTVSNLNSSQFWALSGGQFVSAFSTNESIVWKDATQGDILKLQSNVGGQRSDKFIFTASGDLTVTGAILARTGEFLEIDAFEENNGLIRSFSGDFHDLVIGDPSIYGAFLDNPALQVIGSGIFHSGVFITSGNATSALALYTSATNTTGPNIVIGATGVADGSTNRSNIAIGLGALGSLENARSNNLAIGTNAMGDATAGQANVALGHQAGQNIRPGGNTGGNVFVGANAGQGDNNVNNNTQDCTFIGNQAGINVLQGRDHVAIGKEAMRQHETALESGNVVVGADALRNATAGGNNTIIGHQAGENITSAGGNNTILGALPAAAQFDNTIAIGAGTTQKVLISGDNFTLTSADGDDATFVTSSLTADRNYTLPDQAGTIALTSDIGGGDTLSGTSLSIFNDADVLVARISGEAGGAASFASGQVVITGVSTTSGGSIALGEATSNGTEAFTIKAPAALASGLQLILPETSPTAGNRFLRASGTAVANSQQLEWASSPGGGIAGVTIEDEGDQQGGGNDVTTFDFVGAGVTASVAGDTATITIPGGGAGASGVAGASAWGDIGPDGTVSGSLNVSGVTIAGGAGARVYTVTFDTAMPNADYTVNATPRTVNARYVVVSEKTAQSFNYVVVDSATDSGGEEEEVMFSVFSQNSTLARGTAGTDAWAQVQSNGTIDSSFNIAEVSGVAGQAGRYDIRFTNNMPTANYAVTASTLSGFVSNNIAATALTTSGFQMRVFDVDAGNFVVSDFAFNVNATNANLPATITQEQLDALFDGRAFNGIASWGNVPLGNGFITPNGSLNVSTVEKTATGQYTITFDTPMPNANYSITAACENAASLNALVRAQTANGFDLNTYNTNDNQNTDSQFFFQVVSLNAAPPRGGTGTDAWGTIAGAAGVADANRVLGGFNVSGVSRTADGRYTVTFVNDMPNANYSVVTSATTGVNADRVLVGEKRVGGFDLSYFNTADADLNANFNFTVNATNANLPATITEDQIAALIQNPVLTAWANVNANATTNGIFGCAISQTVQPDGTVVAASAGRYFVRFSQPQPNADYAVTVGADNTDTDVVYDSLTNNGFTIFTANNGLSNQDFSFQVAGTSRNGTLGGGADAWICFDGQAATNDVDRIRGGFNVSSVVRNSTGNYTISFASSFPNTNYCVVGGATKRTDTTAVPRFIAPVSTDGKSVSNTQIAVADDTGAFDDCEEVYVAWFATDGNAGGFITSSGIEGTANQVLTPLNANATFSVGDDAVNLLPSGAAHIYNSTATNDAVCLRINSDVLGANTTAAEIHADGSAHFLSPTNANVAVEARHTGNAGSTALAVTDAGNTRVIQLDNDGGIVASGNIQASGLTDGVTTRTMTEVLANNSGPGSVLQMRAGTLTPIATPVSTTAWANVQTAQFDFTPISATSTLVVDFIVGVRQNNVAQTNIQVNLRATCDGSGGTAYRVASFSNVGNDGMDTPAPVRGIFLAGTTTNKPIIAQAQMNQNAGNATFNAVNVVVTEIAN